MIALEIWKPVVGFEDSYAISNMGRTKSVDRNVVYTDGRVAFWKGQHHKQTRGANGYFTVHLCRNSKRRRALVHRLVAEAFLGEPPEWADCVNHKNGDKTDNRAENLEWSTYGENNRHARDTGLQSQHGENCNLTKYPDLLVAALRRVQQKYKPTYRDLAILFDMPESTVSQIVRGLSRAR